jgi:hypothetical protein
MLNYHDDLISEEQHADIDHPDWRLQVSDGRLPGDTNESC